MPSLPHADSRASGIRAGACDDRQPASIANSPGCRPARRPVRKSSRDQVGYRSFSPGNQFGSRYTIIRLLGSGGMGAVYQAWDETLGIAVALKLIRVDAGTPAPGRRELEDRFKRELKLARQVTHPNVVRIHDLGEVDEHALPHDGVCAGSGPRDPAPARVASLRYRARSRSPGRLHPDSRRRIAPGSSTAT